MIEIFLLNCGKLFIQLCSLLYLNLKNFKLLSKLFFLFANLLIFLLGFHLKTCLYSSEFFFKGINFSA